MSILVKPYEISVWEDVWSNIQKKLVEFRLGVIGSDKMTAQCRAINPVLTRNVNGTKKLSFKMYKHYIDVMTGEKVNNPFFDWLVSERKVKLEYDGEWFDFIIKNVSENSVDDSCFYELEDALVQELSKNGFGKTLNAELMNNSGTAKELASSVLDDTDWTVESETFVEKVDEALVYVNIPANIAKRAVLLEDEWSDTIDSTEENFLTNGLRENKGVAPANFTEDIEALAFYSCCRNKPHRFQFIYLPSYTNGVQVEPNRQISNKNCQYYIEFEPNEYGAKSLDYGFTLPAGISLLNKTYSNTTTSKSDSTISTWYRGARYGFAQKIKYVPLLERYCQIYDREGTEYYGYVDNEYLSPTFVTNLVSNTEFSSTAGWTGTWDIGKEGATTKDKAEIENVYGRFINGAFISSNDVLTGEYKEETLDDFLTNSKAYLKITLKNNSLVINDGPQHNRTLIGNMDPGDKYAYKLIIKNDDGTDVTDATNATRPISTDFGEYIYDVVSGGYSARMDQQKIKLDYLEKNGEYSIYKVVDGYKTEKEFTKNCKLKIVLRGEGTYYIENLEFFKASFDENNQLIALEQQGNNAEIGVITQTYKYFNPEQLKEITDPKDIEYDYITDTLSYNTYKPVYNTNGEKNRTATGGESNYFNLLQSIAETFECWLNLAIEREASGAIKSKKIQLKNYAGDINHAAIRYGVNLKDIQRVSASNNIVTKLIVKQNSNEYGKNGFCTIARAGANPTGENYIYDFQYYQNIGLMDADGYVDLLYKINEDAKGPDLNAEDTEYNLQGYFLRIGNINRELLPNSEEYANYATEINKLEAEKTVLEAQVEAAISGIEEASESFYVLTNVSITDIQNNQEKVDISRSDIKGYIDQYLKYKEEKLSAEEKLGSNEESTRSGLYKDLANKKDAFESLKKQTDALKEHKAALNKLFYKTYSRFIQEGTWISEEYYDDEKYYNDALSVMYNSCYPQVSYTINTLEISQLEGYEMFKFGLGDKTYVEDGEFFGYDEYGVPQREEIIIAEKVENLDDPSQNTNRVQTFKNQFQDLFQKITATTQQVQYSTGEYKKGAALAQAISEDSVEFLADTLSKTTTNLDNPVISSESTDSTSQLKIVDGKMLIGKRKENGDEIEWKTGISADGISASLITAGQVDTDKIQIMAGKDPTFKWDTNGITAYNHNSQGEAISNIDKTKFVRLDKNGLYGVNGDADGENWVPSGADEIDEKSSFSLTWEGLKVTGETNDDTGDTVVARIGKLGDKILDIGSEKEGTSTPLMSFENNGTLKVGGWHVAPDGLTNDNASQTAGETAKEVFLRSTPIERDVSYWSGSGGKDNIVFKAGQNFMVSEDGQFYAKSGYVGNIQIGSVASTKYVDDKAEKANQSIEQVRQELQDQIDGSLSTYFLPYIPTITNKPASDWSKEEDWLAHNGDLFYVISPGGKIYTQETEPDAEEGDYWVNNKNNTVYKRNNSGWQDISGNDEAEIVRQVGFCYRWQYYNEFSNDCWVIVSDSEVAKALELATEAKAIADGKMTVYSSMPTSGMQEGDLLIPTSTSGVHVAGRVYRYTDTDEWKEVDYTDNSTTTGLSNRLTNAENGLVQLQEESRQSIETLATNILGVNSRVDNAESAIAVVQTTASTAGEKADAASSAASEAVDAAQQAGALATNANNNASQAVTTANSAKTLAEATKQYAESEIKELDDSVQNWLFAGVKTLVGDEYVISPYLGGGYLNIAYAQDTANNNKTRVVIDPSNLTETDQVFAVYDQNGIVTIGFSKDGNAKFAGHVEAEGGHIGGWTIGNKGIYADEADTTEEEEDGELGVVGMYYGNRWKVGEGENASPVRFYAGYNNNTKQAKFVVTENGQVYATDAIITTENLTIGDDEIPITEISTNYDTLSGNYTTLENSVGNMEQNLREVSNLVTKEQVAGYWVSDLGDVYE